MAEVRDQLNRPLRDLRISLTDRCNFRCGYCMPKEIFGTPTHFMPREDAMTREEIVAVVRLMSQLGVHKIRLTGGEPLLRQDIAPLIADMAEVYGIDDIALTTNGSMLTLALAKGLKAAGLGRITVSLDSLDAERFGRINGVGVRPAKVLAAIDHAAEAGLGPVKINVVVKRGMNDQDIVPLAERFRFTGHIVRFIEFMDVGMSNRWSLEDVVPAAEILQTISQRWPLHPVEAAYYGEVASRYAYDDGAGEIGLIASVTQPFCGSCTRARLSADGRLLLCLFADHGVNLRDLLRQGVAADALLERVTQIWGARGDRYSELRDPRKSQPAKRLEMFQIGG